MDLKELGRVNPSIHWYYKCKSRYLIGLNKKHLENRLNIIEIGAGSTFFLKEALAVSPDAMGYAVDINYADQDKSEYARIHVSKSLPCVSGDAYLFIDVLEHVEDDQKLLAESLMYAQPGAIIIISVPAFNFLWSGHDDFLEHKRRYTAHMLEKLAKSMRLEIIDRRYIFGALFFIASIFRPLNRISRKKGDNLKTIHPVLNKIAIWVFSHFDIFNRNKFFGLSAVIVLKIPNPS